MLATLIEKDFTTAAETLVENIATPYPEDPALLTVLAKLALAQGEQRKAKNLAQKALETLTKNSSTSPGLSKILFQLEMYPESITSARHTLGTLPSHEETLITLAKAQNALGKYSEAAENLQVALLLAPEQLDLRRDLASYLESAQDWDAALAERERILKTLRGESHAKSRENGHPLVEDQRSLAGCALKAGYPDRAAQVCQKILHTSPKDGGTQAVLGKSLVALGNPQEAIEHLRLASECAPHLADPWLTLAELQNQDEKTNQAIHTLQAGAKSAERKTEIHLALGKIYHAQDEHTQSLAAFREAATLAEEESAPIPLRCEAQLHLGQSLHRLGHIEDSRRTLKAVTKAWPNNIPAARAYGEVLLEMGETRGALPYLAQVVDANPPDAAPYVAYAEAHLSIGLNLEMAINSLRHAIHIESTKEEAESHAKQARLLEKPCLLGKALALLGEALTVQGDIESALDAYQQAMDTPLIDDPDWGLKISLGLGKAALQKGKIETALVTLQDAYQDNGDHLELTHTLAKAYHQANLEAKAQETLQAAFESAPNDLDNLTRSADFAMELGALQIAIPALQEIIRLAPQRVSAYLQLGEAQSLNGERKQASHTFSQLCDLETSSPQPLAQAGEELLKLGEFQKAITCLERAAQICEAKSTNESVLPHTWSKLAICYQVEGDSSQALTNLDKAIAAQLENPVWRLQKAEMLQEMGRYQAALASLHHALDVSPKDPDLHYKAALLYRHVGDGESALHHAAKSEQGYKSLGEKAALKRYHALTLAADLACTILQPGHARKILSAGMDGILETLTDTQYTLLHGVCLYIELLLADDEEIAAAQTLTKLLSISTQLPRVQALQARLTARQGNLEEGSRILEEAIARHEKQPPENVYATTATYLALGQAAQEVGLWNQAIECYQQAADLSPLNKRAQLHLVRAIVLRAEIHRLNEDLQVLHHTPGSESISAPTRHLFHAALYHENETEEEVPPDPQFQKWRLRGDAIFTPNPETATALEELPPHAENLAAQIAAFRYSRLPEKATLAAQEAYPEIQGHPVLAIQTALALLPTDPKMANQAAQTAADSIKDNGYTKSFGAQSGDNVARSGDNVARSGDLRYQYRYHHQRIRLPDPLFHALKAITAQGMGDDQASRQAILAALSYWEDEPRWQALAGEVAETPQNAILHLEKATQLEPEYAGHYLALGKIYLEEEQSQDAISALRQVTHLAREEPHAWLLLGEAYQQTKALDKAIDCTQQALKLSPENLSARKQLAILGMEKGEYSEAETHLRALLKRNPDNAEILELLAQTLSAQNRPHQALDALAKAIPLQKKSLPLQLKRARLLHQTEGLTASLDALQHLAKEYPDHHEVLFPLATSWAEAGERHKAIQTAQQALRSNHGGPTLRQKANTHIFMGRLLRQSGQLDQALHHLHQAVQLLPQSGEAYIEMGKTEHKRRQYDKALEALNQAIKLSPQEKLAYYQAGLVLKELNDYAQAERMLRQAAKLAPNDLRIRRQLGVLATLNLVHGA
ncbi:MAG: Beta-barrel assembly-enhancing protease [Chloroflexi bacterium]|nr:Beta-barrel assembly-enhancing protease [Chloroflexota bacterium]